MTAATPPELIHNPLEEPETPLEALLARLPRQPAEGWLSLLAAGLMVVAYAMAVDDSGWILGRSGDTGYLPSLAVIGLAFGFAGAKLGWGRWRTHLVGALVAGLALPVVAGGAILADADLGLDPQALALRLAATVHVVELVWQDLVIEGRPVTAQVTHYHVVFGAMVWGAGQLVGYTVFGHRRPLDAVVVVGLLVLGNMVLSIRGSEQLPILVLFSAASLLLLVRSHIFDEELAWARRRIGDPRDVGTLYLRGGALFVALAMAGSLALTATASSAPLQDMWKDLPARLVGLADWLQRIAPAGLPFRPSGTIAFGNNEAITGVWNPSTEIAFRAQYPPTEPDITKWRARTYSTYTLYGWSWGDPREETVPPRATLLRGLADQATADGRRQVSIQIAPDAFRGAIISPQAPLSVDISTRAWTIGEDGWFAMLEPVGSASRYNVAAMVPIFGDANGGITEARLRAAGNDYPAELDELYTELPPDAMGPQARDLLQTIRDRVADSPDGDPDNAYDLARAMESYLRSESNFTYDTNIVEEMAAECDGISTAECFARIRRGYCQQYSTTMAVMLRALDIPARIASGFLPGERDEASGVETVYGFTAHWWVEVYFPGVGWVEFDPTGSVGVPQPIPSGSLGPETPAPSGAVPTFGSAPSFPNPDIGSNGNSGAANTVGPFIAIAAILAVGFAALAFVALRRGPRRPMHPDSAWAGLSRWAGRVGLAPKPSQTVYEYAGSLGEEMPAARVELTTIARAKVEVAYGRRSLGEEGLRGIAAAYQRLRLALVTFAIRRGLRRGRRRR